MVASPNYSSKPVAKFSFSVVIPAFNAEQTVGAAIDSARHSGATEVIVVDDGSVDSTAVVARGAGAIVHSQENAGASAAREAGLPEVRTEYVLFLDADDVLVPAGLREAMAVISAEPAAIGVVGGFRVGGSSLSSFSQTVLPWPEGISTSSLLARGQAPAPPGSILWRTEAQRVLFLGDPAALRPLFSEDYEQLIRASMVGDLLSVPAVLCEYNAVDGRSARAPLVDLQAAEKVRRYYGQHAGVPLSERSSADLRALALRRRAMWAGSRPERFGLQIRAVLASPMLWVKMWLRRGARLRSLERD